MNIVFATEPLEALCNDDRLLRKKWGKAQAGCLRRRLDDLSAARCLEDARHLPGGLHELKADRAGQLAMKLCGGDRLVLEPAHEPVPRKSDGGLDWRQVSAIRIVEVVDYHG